MNTKKFPRIADLQETIFEAMPDMMILCQSDMTMLDIIHPKPEMMTTDNPETLIGRRIGAEDLKNVIDAGFEQFEQVVRTRQPSRFIFCRTGARDDKLYHYEASLLYLKTGHVLIQLRTIDEEAVMRIESRHLRHFFADVLDNIAIPIAVKSLDTGRYVYWSRKAEIFGHTAGEMVGPRKTSSCPRRWPPR